MLTPLSATPRKGRAAGTVIAVTVALASTLIGPPAAGADPCQKKVIDRRTGKIICSQGSPGRSPTPPRGRTGTIPTGPIDVENAFQDLGPGQATTAELAQQVSDSEAFPPVKVNTAPQARTYVRVRTALWVDGFQVVQTNPITIDGQTIQATATPKSVSWNLGETTITCNGPGRPNDTSCSHTYNRSSKQQPGGAYRISAAVTWTVAWTCEGAGCDAPSGTLDDLTLSSPTSTLIVDEIQTNTRQ